MFHISQNLNDVNAIYYDFVRASRVAQWSRIHLLMQETQETRVRSLDREDPLDKEMATHPSILAWEIPRTEKPGGLQSMGSQQVGSDCMCMHTHTTYLKNNIERKRLGSWKNEI